MLWAVVLQEKPPFEKGQRVTLYAYSQGNGAFDQLDELEPGYTLQATVQLAQSTPLITFGHGQQRYFLPYKAGNKFVLACLLES